MYLFFIVLAQYTGSWVLGDRGKACGDVCAKTDATCNSRKPSTLVTNELVAEAMLAAGYTCKGFNAASAYPGAPFSTLRSGSDCAPIVEGTTASCTENKVARYKPLCYCEKGKLFFH